MPPASSGTWGNSSTTKSDNDTRWTGTRPVTLKDANGNAVKNATVTFTVSYRTSSNGTWITLSGSYTATTNNSGVASLTTPKFRMSSSNNSPPYATQIRFTITSVAATGSTWDGSNATSNSVSRPN